MGDTSKYEDYEFDDYSANEAYRKYLRDAPKRQYEEHLKKYPKRTKKDDEQSFGCLLSGIGVIIVIAVLILIIATIIGQVAKNGHL